MTNIKDIEQDIVNFSKNDNINNIINNAKFKINHYLHDDYYNNINDIVVTYCEKKNIIFDNTDNIYNLYSINPFNTSNDICNSIFKLDKYISLVSNIHNISFSIKIKNNTLINIYLLFIYNNINIYKQINFIKNDSNNLLNLPPFIKLINIYKILYNPHLFYSYNDNDNLQIDLLNNAINNLQNQDSNIIVTNNILNSDSIKSNLLKKFISKINDIKHIKLDYYYLLELENFISNKQQLPDYNNTLSLILYDISELDVIKNILIQLYNKLYPDEKKSTNLIHIQKNNTYILHDFRLKHFKIYLVHYNKKYKKFNNILLLNVFNSLNYELLPVYKLENNNILHHFVIYRFIFIIILNIKLYETTHLYKIQNYINIILQIKKLKKIENNKFTFTGIYKEYNYDKILYNKEFKDFPYRPLMYFKQHNKLR
jgi:hypothetical protein